MIDLEYFKKLLGSGFQVIDPVMTLEKLNQGDIKPFISVFSIKTDIETLIDKSNFSKTFFVIRNLKTGEQKEILTEDNHVISVALKQIEPIGTQIYAHCSALGGKSSKERIFHLDRLIDSIDGLWDWKFKLLSNVGTFSVTIRINSTKQTDVEQIINDLEFVLDCFALYCQVGFQIQHCHLSSFNRIEPTTTSVGTEERMLEPILPKTIKKIQELVSSSDTKKVARGINQSYIENCMPSRLSMLWATFEDVFKSKPKALLSNDEVDSIIQAVSNIQTLANDPDRLNELKNMLKNPDRIPLKSRNQRLAASVAPIINIEIDEAYAKIKRASGLRGKHVHSISDNWENLVESEEFLRKVLLKYLKDALES